MVAKESIVTFVFIEEIEIIDEHIAKA